MFISPFVHSVQRYLFAESLVDTFNDFISLLHSIITPVNSDDCDNDTNDNKLNENKEIHCFSSSVLSAAKKGFSWASSPSSAAPGRILIFDLWRRSLVRLLLPRLLLEEAAHDDGRGDYAHQHCLGKNDPCGVLHFYLKQMTWFEFQLWHFPLVPKRFLSTTIVTGFVS